MANPNDAKRKIGSIIPIISGTIIAPMDHMRKKIDANIFNRAVTFISQPSFLLSIFPIKTGVNAFLTFSFGLLCILNSSSLICPTKCHRL